MFNYILCVMWVYMESYSQIIPGAQSSTFTQCLVSEQRKSNFEVNEKCIVSCSNSRSGILKASETKKVPACIRYSAANW